MALPPERLEVECSHFQINLSSTYFIISPHFPGQTILSISFLPFCLRVSSSSTFLQSQEISYYSREAAGRTARRTSQLMVP